jgi:hypothetical protein
VTTVVVEREDPADFLDVLLALLRTPRLGQLVVLVARRV